MTISCYRQSLGAIGGLQGSRSSLQTNHLILCKQIAPQALSAQFNRAIESGIGSRRISGLPNVWEGSARSIRNRHISITRAAASEEDDAPTALPSNTIESAKEIGNLRPPGDDNNHQTVDQHHHHQQQQQHVQQQQKPKIGVVLGTATLVILTGVCNRVLYKAATNSMQNYIFFLAQLQTFGYIAVYVTFLALRLKSGAATREMLSIPKMFLPTFIAIGFVEALSSVLSFMGAAKLPGIVLPLLSQSIMIWQVMLAYTVGRRLSVAQLLGVAMVVGGVCLAAWPANPATSPLTGIDPLYAGIFVLSMLFPALDTIFKERVFRNAKKPLGRELDLFVVNTFGSISQAVFVCVLLPFVTKLRGMQLSQLPQYLANGWLCFQGLTPACGSDCGGAPMLPLVYVCVNLAFNIAALNLIRQAGNVVVSLTMSAVVPCAIFAFTLPLPFLDPAPSLGASFFQGTALLMAGLLMYNTLLWWPAVKRMFLAWLEGKEEKKGGEGDGATRVISAIAR